MRSLRPLRKLVVVLMVWGGVLSILPGGDAYGEPSNGYPNYVERSMLVLTNACRVAPRAYRDYYLPGTADVIFATSLYPSVNPLYYNRPLTEAARYHSQDMADHNCFSHSSCDGSGDSAGTRVKRYYTESGGWGENIAAGYGSAEQSIAGLVSDGEAADGSGSDGHRSNIMASHFKEVGNGYVLKSGTRYSRYYTQDFGGGQADSVNACPSGTHFLSGGNVRFWALFFDPAEEGPKRAFVVVGDEDHELHKVMGEDWKGLYEATLTDPGACVSYAFFFEKEDGSRFFYPEEGQFRLFGSGGCAEDYIGEGPSGEPEGAKGGGGGMSGGGIAALVIFLLLLAVLLVVGYVKRDRIRRFAIAKRAQWYARRNRNTTGTATLGRSSTTGTTRSATGSSVSTVPLAPVRKKTLKERLGFHEGRPTAASAPKPPPKPSWAQASASVPPPATSSSAWLRAPAPSAPPPPLPYTPPPPIVPPSQPGTSVHDRVVMFGRRS